MTAFSSVDCLALFNRLAARPSADAITDADKYDRLAKAQDRVVSELAAVAPWTLYSHATYASYPTLTDSGDHQIFTFGTGVTPLGKVQIYTSLNDIPDSPWTEGEDYINEVTQIRIPNNRTYSGTLYWRGISTITPMASGTDPVLFPIASRLLIVIDAVKFFAMEGARNPDLAALMQAQWNTEFPRWCLVWKTQFKQGGALGTFTGRDLAILHQ